MCETLPLTPSHAQGGDWAVARAWRDTGFEARAAASSGRAAAASASQGLCVHLAVASLNDRPASFELTLGGLLEGGDDGRPLNATHIFTEMCLFHCLFHCLSLTGLSLLFVGLSLTFHDLSGTPSKLFRPARPINGCGPSPT